MARILNQEHQEDHGIWVDQSLPAPSEITVSPALLWLIVSVAAIFFISGILHVLLKFFKKKDSNYPSISRSNRYNELHGPQSLGRQLQQLFQIDQDSGLEQAVIDNLPVFNYKNIITELQDPFDCAVCLCEFSPDDKLRLIPICSHAFHTNCIDTWLLSNSTCPLCRVNLSIEHRSWNHNGLRENVMNVCNSNKESENEKNLGKRILSVRLGKLKSLNGEERANAGEISRCNLDARRCFSMGSFQYVVNNIDMQVALNNVKKDNDLDERKIKYESFSVSKVWLWSKKVKYPETEVGGVCSVLPSTL